MPFPENERFARVRVLRLWLWPVIGALFVGVGYALVRQDAPPPFVPIAYATYVFFLLAAMYSLREAGIPSSDVFGRPPDEVKLWGHVILMVPVMFTFAATSLWATAYVASWLFPKFGQYMIERQNDAGPFALGQSMPLLILFVVVVGPVIEEFVFRGVVLRRWMARRTMLRGVVGTSLLFAFLHPPFWIGAFVVGIFLAVLYLVTRSLYAPIAFHAMYNGLVTFATLSAQNAATDGAARVRTVAEFRGQWMLQTAFLLVSGWIIYRTIRTYWLAAKVSASTPTSPPATT